jgi:DNA-binding NarL/FixJ family response regulator
MHVLIVEDYALVREGLRMMIVGTGLFERCVECASLAAALAEARESGDALGLVLLDLGLPDAHGLDALDQFRAAHPDVPIIIVSGGDDAATIDTAFAHGARGYVPKNSSGPALRSAVETVLRGELYVPPHILPSRASGARPPQRPPSSPPGSIAHLTPRQAEVLVLLARGLANKEIGEQLEMSPSTVRAHVSAILKALGVENRTQAAMSETACALLGGRTGGAR